MLTSADTDVSRSTALCMPSGMSRRPRGAKLCDRARLVLLDFLRALAETDPWAPTVLVNELDASGSSARRTARRQGAGDR